MIGNRNPVGLIPGHVTAAAHRFVSLQLAMGPARGESRRNCAVAGHASRRRRSVFPACFPPPSLAAAAASNCIGRLGQAIDPDDRAYGLMLRRLPGTVSPRSHDRLMIAPGDG